MVPNYYYDINCSSKLGHKLEGGLLRETMYQYMYQYERIKHMCLNCYAVKHNHVLELLRCKAQSCA